MLSNDDRVRLMHMLDATIKATKLATGKTKVDLETDEVMSLAIVRLLEIIGEAAKSVSEDVRDSWSSIPWKQIAGTRDRLIHGYFNVDLDIVWSIVSQDLPALKRALQDILE
ncbi:DUF86 domain-containing protein [bacterium]|nr:DUF86 domain-containing protein [bacterium]